MPALTSYSPYETLVFFQNVAQHGADTTSLHEIAATLNQNQLIRESDNYDASKFSVDALQNLYNRTVHGPRNDLTNGINGDAAVHSGNPLKRKVSTSPPPYPSKDNEQFIQQFVGNLYARFREETIKELRQQEDEYERLQAEIDKLEQNVKAEEANKTQQAKSPAQTTDSVRPISAQVDLVSAQLQANLEAVDHDMKPAQPIQPVVHPQQPQIPSPAYERAHHSPVPTQGVTAPRSASGTPHQRHAQPTPSLPQQHTSPGAFNRTLPPPSPQRPNYGALPPPPHAYPQHPPTQAQAPILPPIHSLQRLPSHEGYGPHHRAPSQGRASPMPQHPPQQYPQFHQPQAQYHQQQPPHGWHSPGPQQFSQTQYPQQRFPVHHGYPQQPPNRYSQIQTPNQQSYQPYPHTAPVSYPNQQQQQQQWRGQPMPQYHQYPASASTTPVPRSLSRTSILRSGSNTPWKKKGTPTNSRPRSPSRLDREVSPLSDRDSPPPESPKPKSAEPSKGEGSLQQKAKPRKKSATPAANLSRSQSVMSNVSEAPDPPKRRPGRPPQIKPEPPSTPAPTTTSDSEQQQRSSGRRGRLRGSTNTANKPDLSRTNTTTTNNKRKRDATPTPPPATARARSLSNIQPPLSTARSTTVMQHSDPSFVLVSKSFGRISQLLLNEVTSHKLAGIFAKPLTERDAPGYKSLVHRPQDLKSIKAAISKGSRAAVAAVEEYEARHETDSNGQPGDEVTSTPTPKMAAPPLLASQTTNGRTNTTEGPMGNGFYLLRATEDLVPPKGIVNSSQLEMELARMFANAVMFNPLPTSGRGFGPSLRLRKRGGELRHHSARRSRRAEEEVKDENEADDEDVDMTFQNHEASETATSSSETESSGAEEGGIISDAREMFHDVQNLVTRWRELEGERMSGTSLPSGTSSTLATGMAERHASVSASSVADEGDGDATPSAGLVGSMRKRARVGDH